jgi:hypothetical protein
MHKSFGMRKEGSRYEIGDVIGKRRMKCAGPSVAESAVCWLAGVLSSLLFSTSLLLYNILE